MGQNLSQAKCSTVAHPGFQATCNPGTYIVISESLTLPSPSLDLNFLRSTKSLSSASPTIGNHRRRPRSNVFSRDGFSVEDGVL